MSFNVQVLHLSYFQTSKPASKFYTITLTQIFFSLGKHFEKEEDVWGIPQESVHFRWVHLLKSSSHNLKIDEERHITCVWIESLKKNLKEHIKISHLKTNNRFKAFKLDFFQVCLSFQLNLFFCVLPPQSLLTNGSVWQSLMLWSPSSLRMDRRLLCRESLVMNSSSS